MLTLDRVGTWAENRSLAFHPRPVPSHLKPRQDIGFPKLAVYHLCTGMKAFGSCQVPRNGLIKSKSDSRRAGVHFRIELATISKQTDYISSTAS